MRWVGEYAAVTCIKALYLQYHRNTRKLQKFLSQPAKIRAGFLQNTSIAPGASET